MAWTWTVLAAALAAGGPQAFDLDGPQATAEVERATGFYTVGPVPFADLYAEGEGHAVLSARERIADSDATYGDTATFQASLTLGTRQVEVELLAAGLPPEYRGQGVPPLPEGVAGGVVLNRVLYGWGGLGGVPNTTPVQAAVAVWGVGRVRVDGQVVTDRALVHVAALSAGSHADDDTFRLLPRARPGDLELHVLVMGVPGLGFVQFGFDDGVAISVDGEPVEGTASLPVATSQPYRSLDPSVQAMQNDVQDTVDPGPVGAGFATIGEGAVFYDWAGRPLLPGVPGAPFVGLPFSPFLVGEAPLTTFGTFAVPTPVTPLQVGTPLVVFPAVPGTTPGVIGQPGTTPGVVGTPSVTGGFVGTGDGTTGSASVTGGAALPGSSVTTPGFPVGGGSAIGAVPEGSAPPSATTPATVGEVGPGRGGIAPANAAAGRTPEQSVGEPQPIGGSGGLAPITPENARPASEAGVVPLRSDLAPANAQSATESGNAPLQPGIPPLNAQPARDASVVPLQSGIAPQNTVTTTPNLDGTALTVGVPVDPAATAFGTPTPQQPATITATDTRFGPGATGPQRFGPGANGPQRFGPGVTPEVASAGNLGGVPLSPDTSTTAEQVPAVTTTIGNPVGLPQRVAPLNASPAQPLIPGIPPLGGSPPALTP